jgi:uncharacterized membrane protein YbjE (DUF340 family)
MLLEIGIIAAGVPAGWLLRRRGPVRIAADKTLTWSVRILLFLLGLSLGSDEELLAGLDSLGARAALICLLSVAGSMTVGRLLERRMDLEEKPREEGAE